MNYYSDHPVFLDIVKHANDWRLGTHGHAPTLDEQGWPVSLHPEGGAAFISVGDAGRYVAIYRGDGDLVVSYGGNIVERKPGRVVMDLDGGTVHVGITRTNPSNPLRNLAIVPISHEHDYQQVIFSERFLAVVRPFGVLRFLDWFRINGSSQRRWADRARPDDAFQGTEKGVALEYALALCNRVHADCWLNIPHMADDDYVTRYAETVRERLDPALHVYVEYSNEIWNFPHGDWCQREGEKLGMPRGWDTRLRYQAHRSLEIFRIFENALGAARITRVLAGQQWDARLRIVAEWEDAYRHADALAVAPYFCDELAGEKNVPRIRQLDAGAVAEQCAADVERIRKNVRIDRALARSFGLPLIAYEGGQHLVTSGAFHQDAPLQRLLDDANRHPAMGDAYRRYLDMWREEGGELMVMFELVGGFGKWGRWGLMEQLLQPVDAAPKYRAVTDFLRANPPWWQGESGSGPVTPAQRTPDQRG